MNYLKSSGATASRLGVLLNQLSLEKTVWSWGQRFYTTELYPYTSALYKKNYIRYPVQSKLTVTHDYEFTGDERLPTLSERLKGSLMISRLKKKKDFDRFFGYRIPRSGRFDAEKHRTHSRRV